MEWIQTVAQRKTDLPKDFEADTMWALQALSMGVCSLVGHGERSRGDGGGEKAGGSFAIGLRDGDTSPSRGPCRSS
jgi:hypothetical protein